MIEVPLARDHFLFSLDVESQVHVDSIAEFHDFRYRLVDAATGAEVVAPRCGDSPVYTLAAGDYRLEAFGLGTAHGSYSLKVDGSASGG